MTNEDEDNVTRINVENAMDKTTLLDGHDECKNVWTLADIGDHGDASADLDVDPEFVDGDMCFISSDRVLFRVERMYCLAASPVWRDMLSASLECSSPSAAPAATARASASATASTNTSGPTCTTEPPATTPTLIINLDDPTFENAHTLRTVLLVLTGRATLSYTRTDHLHLLRVYQFTTKWDLVQLTYTLRLFLLSSLSQPHVDPDSVFIMGSVMGDIEICARAVKEGKGWVWKAGVYDVEAQPQERERREGGGDELEEGNAVTISHEDENLTLETRDNGQKRPFTHPELGHGQGYCMNPTTWGSDVWMVVPPTYTWALMRAFERGKDWNERADIFEHLFQLSERYARDCRG